MLFFLSLSFGIYHNGTHTPSGNLERELEELLQRFGGGATSARRGRLRGAPRPRLRQLHGRHPALGAGCVPAVGFEERQSASPQAQTAPRHPHPPSSRSRSNSRGLLSMPELNYGTARRKTSTARVFLKRGSGAITVNGR